MKAILLDFDGCLNVHTPDSAATWATLQPYQRIDYDKVQRLNAIVKATNAAIVFTTTWRASETYNDICRALRHHGFEGFILGAIETIGRKDGEFYYRADEIEYWLDHVEMESFVIIDDIESMHQLKAFHVCCDASVGLTDEDVEKAITILNGEPETRDIVTHRFTGTITRRIASPISIDEEEL